MDSKLRCRWAGSTPLMQRYHDTEWGVPERDARMLWETLMLEGFQAGLSWEIILRKRQGFREAFAGFDPRKVAAFDADDIERLMAELPPSEWSIDYESLDQGGKTNACQEAQARGDHREAA